MTDYNSRQAAIEMIDKCIMFGNTALVDKYEVLFRMRNIPSADVVPVKHGKWIYHDDDGWRYDTYHCSVCRKLFTVDAERLDDIGLVKDDLKFCPHCGARMDGDTDASKQ